MGTTQVRVKFRGTILGPVSALAALACAAGVWGILKPSISYAAAPWIAVIVLAVAILSWTFVKTLRTPFHAPTREIEPDLPERRPENRGYFDDLTNLPARPWFDYVMRAEIARTKRYRHPLSQIILDLDGFQRLNHLHGWANGDYVLMTISDLLRTSVRLSDQVARVAADEFAIVVPDTDLAGARNVAEKLRRAVELFPFDEGLEVTVSVGIAMVIDTDSLESLMMRAESAVRKAREQGGNVCITAQE